MPPASPASPAVVSPASANPGFTTNIAPTNATATATPCRAVTRSRKNAQLAATAANGESLFNMQASPSGMRPSA